MRLKSVLVCGVDEAGRGPLAGAVYAAAVILNPRSPIEGLRDSKQLSERKRDDLALQIRARSLCWSVALASVEEIDLLNIHHATLLAMKRAVEGLHTAPDHVLVDGLYCPAVGCTTKAVVKGDSLFAEISAASILAKTMRDAAMRELDIQYPQYGFALHKGYPTKAHVEALRSHGICAVHRRSYGPVKALVVSP